MRRRARILGVALLLLAGAPAVAQAVGTTSINFEGLGQNTVIRDQYAAQGVRFGTPSDFGLADGTCGAPRAQTPGIAGTSANVSCRRGEFGPLRVTVAFEFDAERRAVSFRLRAPDTATPVTISVHAIGGATLETRQVTLPAGTTVTQAFTRPRPEIVAVRVVGGNPSELDDAVYLDDVSAPIEDPGAVPPKFSLTLLQPTADVIEGSTVSVPVRVNRYNGSVGPVSLTVGGLPSRVDGAQFTPNPVTGRDTTQLRISTVAPLTGDRQLTVTASRPPGAPAGVGDPVGAAGVQTVRGQPAVVFSGRFRPDVVYTPGCSALPKEYANVRGGYTGDIAVRAETVVGATGPPGSKSIRAATDGELIFDYPVPFTGPGDGVVRLTLSPAGATPVSRDVPVKAAPPIAEVTPSVVRTPQALRPGTLVTLKGEGLCASGGAKVRFGNKFADAPIISHSADGRTVTAQVPPLATSGPVGIVTDAGTVLNGPSVQVDSYRNTVGFAFHNYTPRLTVDQMSAIFGREATHISVDGCGILTLGLKKCRVITPIPDPWAMAVLAIANATMGGGDGGACFGFSRTSQELRLGRRTLRGLGSDTASNAFGLPGPAGPGGSINEAINANQMAQLSNEYLSYYLSQAASNTLLQSPGSLRRDIEARLRNNDHPMLSLRDGGSLSKLHVVIAYGIEEDPADPGAYFIDVYDSNLPFVVPGYASDGKVADSFEDSDAATHKLRAESSRIRVRADGFWQLPSSGMSASSLGNIIVGSVDNPPAKPTLVTAAGLAKEGLSLIFGSSAGAGIRQAGPGAGAGPPPATTEQITAGGRRLFRAPGVLETDRAAALNATPWTPSTGGAAADGFILGAGPQASYAVDLKGTRPGSQTRTILGNGVMAQITAPARAGVTDKLTVSPDAAAIGFAPGGSGAVPLTLQVMARQKGGATHNVQLQLSSAGGGSDAVAFDPSLNSVRITHDGPPTTAKLTLSSFGRTLPQAATLRVRIARKGVTSVRPESWDRLAGGRAVVRSGKTERRLALRVRRARGATLAGLRVVKAASRRIARAEVTVPGGAVAGTASVTFTLTRGKRLVGSQTAPAGGPGKRAVTWALPGKPRRGDRVTAVATTVVAQGNVFNTAASRRTLLLR